MTTVNQTPNGVYLLNLTIPSHQFFETINACLCKAHALAAIATTIDLEAYSAEVFHDYLWALSDIIHEAKWLHDRANYWEK